LVKSDILLFVRLLTQIDARTAQFKTRQKIFRRSMQALRLPKIDEVKPDALRAFTQALQDKVFTLRISLQNTHKN